MESTERKTMHIKIKEVLLEERGETVGVELNIEGIQYFHLINDDDLPGLRNGTIVPPPGVKFKYEVLYSGEIK